MKNAIKYLVCKSKGNMKLMDFLDDRQMSTLYEKFVLNYYRKEHPYIKAHAPQIPWQIDDGEELMLLKMKSGVTLEYGLKILIIDTKFYSHNISENYGKNICLNCGEIVMECDSYCSNCGTTFMWIV